MDTASRGKYAGTPREALPISEEAASAVSGPTGDAPYVGMPAPVRKAELVDNVAKARAAAQAARELRASNIAQQKALEMKAAEQAAAEAAASKTTHSSNVAEQRAAELVAKERAAQVAAQKKADEAARTTRVFDALEGQDDEIKAAQEAAKRMSLAKADTNIGNLRDLAEGGNVPTVGDRAVARAGEVANIEPGQVKVGGGRVIKGKEPVIPQEPPARPPTAPTEPPIVPEPPTTTPEGIVPPEPNVALPGLLSQMWPSQGLPRQRR